MLKAFETIIFIATTSSFIMLSLKGSGLIVIPISTARACGLTICNKVMYGIVMRKNKKYKRQLEKYQQTSNSFDELYCKTSQDNLIEENE